MKNGGDCKYTLFHYKEIDTETRETIKVTIEWNEPNTASSPTNSQLSLVCVYRDCKSSTKEFIRALEAAVVIENEKTEIEIILGDINIDILNEQESADYSNSMAATDGDDYGRHPRDYGVPLARI